MGDNIKQTQSGNHNIQIGSVENMAVGSTVYVHVPSHPRIKILFLSSNPLSDRPLQLDEEARLIMQKIRASDFRDNIELVTAWAVRPDDLLQLLNEHKPQIVHFSGHGMGSGKLVLTGSDGSPKTVSVSAIASLLGLFKQHIRIILLNACFSNIQAKAVQRVIDCTIGMRQSIGDEAARIFAASFYRAIGFGSSVQDAFEQGKVAVQLEGIPEEKTPELTCKPGVDPAAIILVS